MVALVVPRAAAFFIHGSASYFSCPPKQLVYCPLRPTNMFLLFLTEQSGAEQNRTEQTLTSHADGYASPPAFPPPSRVKWASESELTFLLSSRGDVFLCMLLLLTGLLTYHITLFNVIGGWGGVFTPWPSCHLHGKNMFKAKKEEEEFMGNSNIYFTLQK
jgi:hypothetical protein